LKVEVHTSEPWSNDLNFFSFQTGPDNNQRSELVVPEKNCYSTPSFYQRPDTVPQDEARYDKAI
jgi:hypothetical protein